VVDDEPLAHQVLEGYAARLPDLERVAACFSAADALEVLRREAVDLMFLDIQLPRVSGFDLLRALPRPPLVIAVTAHRDYALEGWDLAICDYLLKPFSFDRFLRAVEKARLLAVGEEGSAPEPTGLLFKDGRRFRRVLAEELEAIQAAGNFAMVLLQDGRRFLTQETMVELAERLSPVLVRVHKSWLVSTGKITAVAGSELEVGGRRVPIGRAYRQRLLERLDA
jgi:DNA-binding LytR/AlgR family response regulator